MPRYTRRRLVAAGIGYTTIGSLAGCLSNDAASTDSGRDGPQAQSSFFVFGELASQVAGDIATAETLVPIGQHGHGWEPGPQIQGTVLDSDLFVYGMEGFQPWADDLVTSLRDDDTGVDIVAAGAGIDLIEGGRSHDHGHDEGHDGDGEHDHEEGDHSEHEGEENDTGHEGEGGHDHSHAGGGDPHFWLDPIRAKQAVDNIQSGFADVDSDNDSTYGENANAYRSRLDELDESFQSALESASKDVVFVAGHNAFQYLGQHYDFEVQTLTGLSPDDQPTPKDIERAQEIIAEHDLQYVCADPLESQTAANQLVEETDATEVLPLTPIPGQTQEWADEDWGYVEIMANVNLETLKQALDAE
ncbi:high-affinity zinc transporter periplasmic component [Halalkalicoccus paucihalophilus]|uniref:High-affinity zinc transporter periplasmic component n=1 Tax=Halalkalicoccus paucihalophilus TaxID=1008153 RepID=A0A151A9A0_9EURY|nr:zinc ABC transporter substrate-binding protein [Halalkalicoccus paucihalophilus]KYH23957.1 high-affinity zinc transporter periplasmic component [Halalkalicoccus paucihalophilus]